MKLVFTDDFITQVKEANDIINIASEYFDIKRVGDLYKAKCKHPGGDKTPSLAFFPDTQSFYCFSCHAGGRNETTNGSDIVSFVQWMEDLSWQDAIILLAERADIEIPKAELSNEDRQRLMLHQAALIENRIYWTNLSKDFGIPINNWFKERGIDETLTAKWRLGAIKAKVDGADKVVPVYAIMDEYGRTCAFSRRVAAINSKYINDSTSPIFKKGNILYGLNFIKKEIRRKDFIVLVEGYNDAIILQEYNVPATAIMSTTITDGQIQLIKKYTKNVILFLDGDGPGIEHTITNIKLLKANGFEVEVLNILGFDPDDVALKYKEEVLDFILSNKKLAFQFLINNVLDKYFDKMIRLKRETVKQLEDILEYIEDDQEREVYKDQLFKIISMEDKARL